MKELGACGNPAVSPMEIRGFASPPHGGFALARGEMFKDGELSLTHVGMQESIFDPRSDVPQSHQQLARMTAPLFNGRRTDFG